MLIASNALFVLAFACRSLLDDGLFLLLAALLLVTTLLVERSYRLFEPQPPYYARLRLELTCLACIALVVSAPQLR